MSANNGLFEKIASDIGVFQYQDEGNDSFYFRTIYSASRFWLSAFCMDDGNGGTQGITPQAMNHHLKKWISLLNNIQPGISSWFTSESSRIPKIYNALIDIGDLIPNGFSNNYLPTMPVKVDLSSHISCITGFLDPTSFNFSSPTCSLPPLITSGLTTLFQTNNDIPLRTNSWWVKKFDYMNWINVNNYEDIYFANTHSYSWSIRKEETWGATSRTWQDNFTLGLGWNPSTKAPSYLLVKRKKNNQIVISQIDAEEAQIFFFYLKQVSGNPAIVRYNMLDNLHIRTSLPSTLIFPDERRFINAISWPILTNTNQSNDCIIRTEALPLLEEMLSANFIHLERDSHVQQ